MGNALEIFTQQAYREDEREAQLINDAYDGNLKRDLSKAGALSLAVASAEFQMTDTVPVKPGIAYEICKQARRYWMYTTAYLQKTEKDAWRLDILGPDHHEYYKPEPPFETHTEKHEFYSKTWIERGEDLVEGDVATHALFAALERERTRRDRTPGEDAAEPFELHDELATNAMVNAMEAELNTDSALQFEDERAISGIMDADEGEEKLFTLSSIQYGAGAAYDLRVYDNPEVPKESVRYRIFNFNEQQDRLIETIESDHEPRKELNMAGRLAMRWATVLRPGNYDFSRQTPPALD